MSTVQTGSRRTTRMLRRRLRAQRSKAIPLNLVSMIDVFTTILFFLMVTAPNVNVLQSPRTLVLPQSSAYQPPGDAAIVTVTREAIELQGKRVMGVAEAQAAPPNAVLPDLKFALNGISLMQVQGGARQGATTRGEINIMADRGVPYSLLRKVLATCQAQNFARISLSINRSSHGFGGSGDAAGPGAGGAPVAVSVAGPAGAQG